MMDSQELEKLIAPLAIQEPEFRETVAEGLRRRDPSHEVLVCLKGLLASASREQSSAAGQVLRRMGRPGVTALEEAARKHDSPSARAAALRGLGESGQEGCFKMFESYGELGVDPLPTMKDALSDSDGTVRSAALWGLGRLQPRDDVLREEAAKHLQDPDPKVRGTAASLLGRFHTLGPSIEKTLSVLLRDPEPKPRMEAAFALAGTGIEDDRVCDILIEASEHPNPFARLSAASRLRHYPSRSKDIVPALARLLRDPEIEARKRALDTLASFGPRADAAIPAIQELLQDRAMASDCARILGSLGPRGIEASANMLSAPEEDVRYQVLTSLWHLGEKAAAAVPHVLRCLEDPLPRVRFRATQCLLSIDPSQTPEIISRIRAASEFDRSRLILYVAELGEPAAAALKELARDEDPALRELASTGLARLASIQKRKLEAR